MRLAVFAIGLLVATGVAAWVVLFVMGTGWLGAAALAGVGLLVLAADWRDVLETVDDVREWLYLRRAT